LLLLLAGGVVAVMLTTGLFILSTTYLRPAVHALTSKQAAGGQGAALGLSNSFVSLGRVVGPIYAGAVFDANPNYPYLSGAAILFAVFLFSLGWVARVEKTGSLPAAP
jgi:DHA1 family multidrug resistance protein-like MFS transporter